MADWIDKTWKGVNDTLGGTPGYRPEYQDPGLQGDAVTLYGALGQAPPGGAEEQARLDAEVKRLGALPQMQGITQGMTLTPQQQYASKLYADAVKAASDYAKQQAQAGMAEQAAYDVAMGATDPAQDDALLARRAKLQAEYSSQGSREAGNAWESALSDDDRALLLDDNVTAGARERSRIRGVTKDLTDTVDAQFGGAQDVALQQYDTADKQRVSVATALANQTKGVGRLGAQAQLAGNMATQAGQSGAERQALSVERRRQGREQFGLDVDQQYENEYGIAKALQGTALQEHQAKLGLARAGTEADIAKGQANQGIGRQVAGGLASAFGMKGK